MAERPDSATAQLKLRVRETVRHRLESAARTNGWPLNKEIERRLSASFEVEDQAGGAQTAALLRLIAADISAIEAETGHRWSEDYATWQAVRETLKELIPSALTRYRPPLPNEDEYMAQVVGEQVLAAEMAKVAEELTSLGFPAVHRLNALARAGGHGSDWLDTNVPQTVAGHPAEQEVRRLYARLKTLSDDREAALNAAIEAGAQARAEHQRGKDLAVAQLEAFNERQISGRAEE